MTVYARGSREDTNAEVSQASQTPVSLRSAPFTMLSLAGVIVFSAVAGALGERLSDARTDRWGLGPESISSLHVWGLFTANYLVDKPIAIISTVVMTVVFLGWVEVRYGLLAAVVTWFAGTWAGTLLAVLAWWPFALLGIARPLADVAIAEVGSSAATWAAVGVTLGWPGAWSGGSLAGGLAATAFLVGLLAVKQTFTDVEHLAAFAFGMLVLAPLLAGRARPVALDSTFLTRLLVGLSGITALLTAWTVGGAGWPLMVVAGTLLVALAVWPVSRVLTLALLAAGGAASVLATPNPAAIAVFVGAAALLLWPGLADSPDMRVR